MAEFERKDDRISSMEVPAALPQFTDMNGVPWRSRPDNVLKRYLINVIYSDDKERDRDQKFKINGLIDSRDWFTLQDHLETINLEGDDQIRIEKSKEVLDNLIKNKEQENEL